jgi:integral membrane protein
MTLKTPLGRLRIIAILEGISYLLFAITMPLKYMYGYREPNLYVGMSHGWLFIGYILLSLQNIMIYKWNFKTSIIILAASLIPFATFIVDHRIFKKLQNA